DLYGAFAVLKLYSAGLAAHRSAIVDALRGEVALAGIYGRDEEIGRSDEEDELSDRDSPPARGRPLWGTEPPVEVIVREQGMRIAVDLRAGQKTGYFLDQRENGSRSGGSRAGGRGLRTASLIRAVSRSAPRWAERAK